MRFLYLFFTLIFACSLPAQVAETTAAFQLAEHMPRFPGCEDQGLADSALKKCSSQKLLEFIYSNVEYPEMARKDGIEGTVVIRFVVLRDGTIDGAEIVREIGGGCGEEALRVVNLMDEKAGKWIPGMQKGEAVKVYFNLPIKFKFEKETPPPPPPAPYVVIGMDTIYTEYEEAPVYGKEARDFQQYMETLPYPENVEDCLAGSMVVQFFISKKGEVKIGELYDYADLGFDFQFEAIQHLNTTNQKWQPAGRKGQAVNCYLPLRLTFKPKGETCQSVVDNYDLAYAAAAEAEELYAAEKVTEAIAKWDESLVLFPGNAEIFLLRGQAYLEINEKEKACSDLQTAKKVVPLADWVEKILPIICN